MQLNGMKKAMRYVIYIHMLTILVYFALLTKMPWIYKFPLSRSKKMMPRSEEVYSAYLLFGSEGDSTELMALKKTGISFEAPYQENGDTLLHDAVYQNKIDVCKWLIEYANVDPNIKNNAGLTPLDYDLWRGNTYEYMVKSGGRHSWKYYFWLQNFYRR